MNNEDERDSAEEEWQSNSSRLEAMSEHAAERFSNDPGLRFHGCHWVGNDTGPSDFRSLRARVFSLLLELVGDHVKAYRSDLFHDAAYLMEHLHGEMTIYYAVRESGTAIGTDRELVSSGMGRADRLYRFEIMSHKSYSRTWYAAIGKY